MAVLERRHIMPGWFMPTAGEHVGLKYLGPAYLLGSA